MQDMAEVYQKYARTVYRYLLSLTHDDSIAEELTQETFYQAIRTSNRYDESCKLTTWLCGIARNTFLTYLRKHPVMEDIEEQTVETGSAEADVLRSEDRVELFRILHLLEDPFREVMYLRVFGELSFKEIGEVLGKKENWARVTFYRGREKLKEQTGHARKEAEK